MADAVDCVAELRVRIGSPARTYKANHLLREKHRPTLEWFLGPDGPISGRARVVLVDKERFLFGTFLGLLANPDIPGWLAAPTPAWLTGPAPGWPTDTSPNRPGPSDLARFPVAVPTGGTATTRGYADSRVLATDTTRDSTGSTRGATDPTAVEATVHDAGSTAHDVDSTGRNAGSTAHDTATGRNADSTGRDADSTGRDADSTDRDTGSAILDAVNELLRGRLDHDEFRLQAPDWLAGHDDAVRAIAVRQSRRNPDRVVLDPLFWAITRVADVWGGPVAVVHDRHLSLTPSRVAALVAAGGLARFDIASAGLDARVQLADFLAGIVRRTCTAALGGAGDTLLLDLVRPYLAAPQ